MTDEEIIEAAREAGFMWVSQWQIPTCDNKCIKEFARLIAAKQREMIVCKLLELGALEDGDYIAAIRSQKP